jgi:hypothetical protein
MQIARRVVLVTLFSLALISGVTASAQVAQNSPIPGMDRQCVLNHPFRADLVMAMVGQSGDAKKPATQIGVPGEIVRDSEGRQKIVMNVTIDGAKDPLVMIMMFEPPEGKVRMLMPSAKLMTTRDMPQVHCGPVPTEPDFSEITKQGGTVTPLGTKDFGELRATGYKLTMDVPGKDAKPQKVEVEFWTDMVQQIPVSVTAKSGTAFSMDMEFTNVKLVEPSPDEFKVPDGYREMTMPDAAAPAASPDAKAATPAPAAAK